MVGLTKGLIAIYIDKGDLFVCSAFEVGKLLEKMHQYMTKSNKLRATCRNKTEHLKRDRSFEMRYAGFIWMTIIKHSTD